MSESWIVRNAEQLDPVAGHQDAADLYIADGHIVASAPSDAQVIDARGLTIMPGLIDLHVHFREPGHEAAETIASGSRAAARGGFTTVVTMPNTRPAVDTPAQVAFAFAQAAAAGVVELLPSACITRERRGGELTDLTALAAAGAAAFTDDGSTVTDDGLMRSAMEQAAALGLPIMDHALDPVLAGRGVLHDGEAARRLGLPGIPSEAEDRIVARDIALARATGCATHIQHISSATAARMIMDAAARGVPVTGEVTPHHLALSDADIISDDGNFKMNPPLRSPDDRETLIEAVLSGGITIMATDHAPHLEALKAKGIRQAPFGVVGLETALGVTYQLLVVERGMKPRDWLRCWTQGPAQLLGRPCPTLVVGARADIVLADLQHEWIVRASRFVSRSHNTPFENHRCRGRALMTFCAGKITARDVDTAP